MVKIDFVNKKILIIEFIALCIVVPGIIMFEKLAFYMFLFLWGASFYAYFVMRTVYNDKIKQIWNGKAITKENLKPIVIRWVFASFGMFIFIYFYSPDKIFGLINYKPEIIPLLLIFYPIFSALPQEFIFCSFFFERYEKLFGNGKKMMIASSIVFAYAHLLYINPVAPTLSLLGGLIFASTYLKTKSLALVTIEHGLYGNSLFLIGLGYYFYGGNVH